MTKTDAVIDAVVVGSGPNGLAAAITLAQAGLSVQLYEARPTIGGGMRTLELTLPGFQHDICSAIHPLGMGSPFFSQLPLDQYGLQWVQPNLPLAHPLDDGSAVALHRSPSQTGDTLGTDGATWQRLLEPLVADWEKLAPMLLGPLPTPRHPLALLRFGLFAPWPAKWLAQLLFKEERARALLAGLAAHSIMPLEKLLTASFGLVLGILAHRVGWPLPRGGSQQIANALAAYFQELGGQIQTNSPIADLAELPPARLVMLDVTPRQLLALAGNRLPASYQRRLERYRYGPGVFKIDYALSEPIPWRAEACRHAGTVHVGGTLAEIAAAEREVWRGQSPERPFVLVAQQSLFDESRAPNGQQTGWAYCHAPHGSSATMINQIEAQIERFAPGFRDCILARAVRSPTELEAYNPNYIGGDINGGVQDLRQLWTRPLLRFPPYATPIDNLYLCSSATPPGGGVHGMCGYHAAQAALRRL